MKRDVSLYIKDIIEHMELAEDFVSDMSYEEFIIDKRTYLAVLRCIEIIGEAVKHVPDDIRKKYPQIPWKDIAGMRDKVTHLYFRVSLEKVWLVLEEDIPNLKPLIEEVLSDMEK